MFRTPVSSGLQRLEILEQRVDFLRRQVRGTPVLVVGVEFCDYLPQRRGASVMQIRRTSPLLDERRRIELAGAVGFHSRADVVRLQIGKQRARMAGGACGAIGLKDKPIRVDLGSIDAENEYFKQPVEFEITLRYKLPADLHR